MEQCAVCQKAHAPLEGHCHRLLELERILKKIDAHDKPRFQALLPAEQKALHQTAGNAARELDFILSVERKPGIQAKADNLRRLAGLLIAWTAEFSTK